MCDVMSEDNFDPKQPLEGQINDYHIQRGAVILKEMGQAQVKVSESDKIRLHHVSNTVMVYAFDLGFLGRNSERYDKALAKTKQNSELLGGETLVLEKRIGNIGTYVTALI